MQEMQDTASIPELGKSPGAGNGNLLQYSCWENTMDRRAWKATFMGLQSWTQLGDWAQAQEQCVYKDKTVPETGFSFCVIRISLWQNVPYTWEGSAKVIIRDFPGGLVAKTPRFQSRGPGFNPW